MKLSSIFRVPAGCGLIVLASFGWAPSGLAQPYIEKGANGSINWGTGEISAVGIGVPPERYRNSPVQARAMAIRAAKVDALRNLLEQVEGVRVESQTLVKDMAVESDLARSRVQGTVRNASMVGRPHEQPDGSVEVVMAINFHQSLARTLLDYYGEKLNRDSEGGARAQSGAHASASSSLPRSEHADAAFSGLVIDARGKGLEAAAFPRILDEDGHVVYSSSMVVPERRTNIVAYDTSPDDAVKLDRLGGRPLVIRALRVQDRTDVVISNADARKIGAAAGMQEALRQARVAFAL